MGINFFWWLLQSVSYSLGFLYSGQRNRRLCGRLWVAEAYSPLARYAVQKIDTIFGKIGDGDHCRRCFIEDHRTE